VPAAATHHRRAQGYRRSTVMREGERRAALGFVAAGAGRDGSATARQSRAAPRTALPPKAQAAVRCSSPALFSNFEASSSSFQQSGAATGSNVAAHECRRKSFRFCGCASVSLTGIGSMLSLSHAFHPAFGLLGLVCSDLGLLGRG
jgi:hypothetical protein